MEHPPAGKQIDDPLARRPRAPAINLARHDIEVREREHAPQRELWESGGAPTMARNAPVLGCMENEERKEFDAAIARLQAIYRTARERHEFQKGNQPEAKPVAEPEPSPVVVQVAAEPARPKKPKAKGARAPEAKPEPVQEAQPLDEEEDFDAKPIDENAMNAAFAAALEQP